MTKPRKVLNSASADETANLAVAIGKHLKPGDCLLLQGPIGSGKTHFSRNLIQSLLDRHEDVPSPTFTLVQTYDTSIGEVWHADLYRLTSADEVEELGLAEAFETAICLVEWPEKLGPNVPESALHMTFSTDPKSEDARQITLDWTDEKWAAKLESLPHG